MQVIGLLTLYAGTSLTNGLSKTRPSVSRYGMNARALCFLISVATIAACENRNDTHSSRIPGAPMQLVAFAPANDPTAVRLWDGVSVPSTATASKDQLAQRYDELGFQAMAKFVRASSRLEKDSDVRKAVDEILATRNPSWACPDAPSDAVMEQVAVIDGHINTVDYAAARRAGADAIQKLGPACPLLTETAVATLAAAAWGSPVSTEEFELALRTALTADIEMGLAWHGGAREWLYQIAAISFLRRNDPASAVIASEMALARFSESVEAGRGRTAAAEALLRQLAKRAREELRRR